MNGEGRNKKKFVVAFNRDRDSYQVPLALAESGFLDRLISDFYLPKWLAASIMARKLGVSHRNVGGIPFSSVEWCFSALYKQLLELRLAKSEIDRLAVFKSLDKNLSRHALYRARRSGADLLIYSGYALECFKASETKQRRKVLFVFHPHSGLSDKILGEDRFVYPKLTWSHELHRREMESSDSSRLEEEIFHADELICASSFTERSIRHLLSPNQRVTVVPYGCDVPIESHKKESLNGRPVRLLFVGQGVQRKGLHHLVKVWKSNRFDDSELTVIASKIDPFIEHMITECGPAVRLLPTQSRSLLAAEFARADVFVMPSLVEGFGLVYLEALAAGCHVIGTDNTGLPDLRAPGNVVTLIRAGDHQGLADAIGNAINLVRSSSFSVSSVTEFVVRNNWSVFREGIRRALDRST